MKEKLTNMDLDNIKLQPIIMQHHRVALRRTLLTSPYWDKKQTNIFLFWKGGEKIMKKRKLAITGLALGVMVVAVVASAVMLPKNTKTAYAEEIAQKSYDAVVTLKPEEQEALKHKVMFGDPQKLLQKAKDAKDLKVLTYDEFVSQQPAPPPGKPEGEGPDLQGLNFLQFTDEDGSKVILGVDPKTNLPAIILVSRGNLEDSSKPRSGEKGVMFKSSAEGESGNASFGSSAKHMKSKIGVMMHADGTGTVVVNGKKYAVPEGAKLSANEPPSIKVEGDDVYVNGVKATPVE